MPDDATIENHLLSAADAIFARGDEDALTVNVVRRQAERDSGLEPGFLDEGEWKGRSKRVIRERVDALFSGDVKGEDIKGKEKEEKKEGKAVKEKAKPAPKKKEPAPKKKEPAPKNKEPTPRNKDPTPRKKASAAKKSKTDSDSELSDLGDLESDEKPREITLAKRTSKTKVNDSESALSDLDSLSEGDGPAGAKRRWEDGDEGPRKKTKADDEVDEEEKEIDEEEEYSDVIDAPATKRTKSKTKSPPKASSKSPKKVSKKVAKSSSDDDPLALEQRKLQQHLAKCGIRKVWPAELRRLYGDDARAKITHLRNLLRDIGMPPRFSEAKAREIRERRELLADVEDVVSGEAVWGVSARGGRASRLTAKEMRETEEVNEEKEDEEDENEEVVRQPARARGARAMLAFLGDDDDESDISFQM